MRISAVCHFHNERHALPGFIETAERMFDEIVLVSSPMDGTPADPETIAIAEASGHKLIHDTLSQGFGALRTRCIGYSSCEWVMILDADERVWPLAPILGVTGTGKFPETLTPDLHVSNQTGAGGNVNQREKLRHLIGHAEAEQALAICVSRRHWFGAPGEWDRPCQNWHAEHDWQLRLLKNTPFLCYDPEVKMHERLIWTPTWAEPKFIRVTDGSLYIDHYSHHYRAMEPEQNTEDIATYEALMPGCTKDMWISHQPKA
jgi:hypothetical protein